MCTFVTAIVTGVRSPASIERTLEREGFVFDRIENENLASQMPDGAIHFHPTGSICECGTPVGALYRAVETDVELAKKIARLRKKGWGEAKIERWRADREAARRKQDTSRSGRTAQLYVDLVHGLLESGDVERVGLLVHEYAVGFDDERVTLRRIETLGASEARDELLLRAEDDVLYCFGARPDR